MKYIVALDTSTEACSVALSCDDEPIFRYVVEPRIHAKALLPMLDELLAEAGISPKQLDGVAFARGPGAFTGVRIGTAAAQAIAFGGDLPVAPVSTIAAIAHRCFRERGKKQVAVAIDARMGEVYWGAYRIIESGILEGEGKEKVCSPTQVDRLESLWIGAGTGWSAYAAELATATDVTVDAGVDPFPHALDILHIGRRQLMRGEGVSPEHALPVYLRDNVALTIAERAVAERAAKQQITHT